MGGEAPQRHSLCSKCRLSSSMMALITSYLTPLLAGLQRLRPFGGGVCRTGGAHRLAAFRACGTPRSAFPPLSERAAHRAHNSGARGSGGRGLDADHAGGRVAPLLLAAVVWHVSLGAAGLRLRKWSAAHHLLPPSSSLLRPPCPCCPACLAHVYLPPPPPPRGREDRGIGRSRE